ncbi:hypothetical protein [Persicirhabdus sediminis]|uniref:Uncharacterized protein n=1 Tax=Persicirhabdus sediminis TaxID=454144 RepID=A0A8J7MDZ8_9BACT|nr:hypothetical protein [Persicirhabdus sediminis]MBK1791526.1 hypothetical protein [Persicirhabdus sediminis]
MIQENSDYKPLNNGSPPVKMDEVGRRAQAAANRAAEKMIERKRRLGHKVVIYKDGKVLTVDP